MQPARVLVVGAGIVGLSCAWLLQRSGHAVELIDPRLADPTLAGGAPPGPARRSGSGAALGVLMAQVFHRSRGRAWRLRQRSLELWTAWQAELASRGHRIPHRRGLLLLAADGREWERQQQLVRERQTMGLPLELWPNQRLAELQPAIPAAALGALHSPQDGQLDPNAAMAALLADARAAGLRTSAGRVSSLRRNARGLWQLEAADGTPISSAPWLVLTAGVSTAALLAQRGHALPLEPVAGQALTLELAHPPPWTWPGVVVWRGINLVPRPDLAGGRRFWLGATVEVGQGPDEPQREALRHWGEAGLAWLDQAVLVESWEGDRARPMTQPAPVLEQPEAGLLVATGHHRNGVLLAPASAEWVLQHIEGEATPH